MNNYILTFHLQISLLHLSDIFFNHYHFLYIKNNQEYQTPNSTHYLNE